MTSYSAQGATVDRVLVQIDTQDSRTRQLVDKTLAYVALSRPRYDIAIFTDRIERLAPALSREVVKPKALSPAEIGQYREEVAAHGVSL
jgi:ATP-dependent exoDNAse (exonuclease V) alpha subunit